MHQTLIVFTIYLCNTFFKKYPIPTTNFLVTRNDRISSPLNTNEHDTTIYFKVYLHYGDR